MAGDFFGLAGASRLDWRAFDDGKIRMRYSATDPVWADVEPDPFLVDLREHVRRLCVAAHEMATHPLGDRWDEVAHNLRLAYSLVDVFAETDVDGASMWCSPVADYESANGELTEKHLAATIVFTFVWTAYECAVEALAAPLSRRAGRGAKGRDLVAAVSMPHLPFLRIVLLNAAEFDRDSTDFSHPDMRRMLQRGSIPGIAGEHLRQFRNRLIHGDLPKPEPEDWGDRSEYVVDEDPHLRRFHANIRLVLLLLQTLAIDAVDEDQELEAWLEGPCCARLALQQLHCCESRTDARDEPELDLDDETIPSPKFMWG
ncbi:MAG: hypothetical protein QOI38_2717 [Sphingomonadales bacterium]|jgi:hypothetical protein|nr:hypothetical protein [Sphingomonadales bacterium]